MAALETLGTISRYDPRAMPDKVDYALYSTLYHSMQLLREMTICACGNDVLQQCSYTWLFNPCIKDLMQ
jgi:hypothetical protein